MRGIAGGWIALIRTFRADAIAADHAPGALIAGRILALPQVQIGTGFEIPPLLSPMPSIRPWEAIPAERLRASERQLVERINGVVRSLRGKEMECLADWFHTDAGVYTTFHELDPFGPRPGERYAGPIYETESGDPAAWPESKLPRIFAYLRGDVPGVKSILKALSSAEAETLCVVPGVRPAAMKALASDRLRLASRPVQLKSALSGAALVLSYGGHGVVCAALAAGVPLLIAPQTVEQYLHGKRVEASGAGMLIEKDRSVEAVSARIAQILRDEGIRKRAGQFARRHAGLSPAGAAAEAAAIIGTVARGDWNQAKGPVIREARSAR